MLENPPRGWLNSINSQTGTYAVVNSDFGDTVALGGVSFYDVTLAAAAGFRPDFICALANVDAARGKRIVPNGVTPFILYPGQTAILFVNNGAWSVMRPTRWKLTAAVTLYVDGAGSANNDGLAAGAGGAYATMAQAISAAQNNIDLQGQNLTISVADATYTVAVTISGPFTGQNGATVTLQGNVATPANCIISTTSANAIRVANGAVVTITGFKLQTTTGGDCLQVDGARAALGPMEYGACAGNQIRALNNGYVNPTSDYTISGGAVTHWAAAALGLVNSPGRTITLTGTPAFSATFAQAFNLGSIVASSTCTFVGAATGVRYTASLNGVIRVDGAGAAYLPGSVAGAAATGGQYA